MIRPVKPDNSIISYGPLDLEFVTDMYSRFTLFIYIYTTKEKLSTKIINSVIKIVSLLCFPFYCDQFESQILDET